MEVTKFNCHVCGAELLSGPGPNNVVYIYPCDSCVETEAQVSFDDGYKKGHEEGYEEGYEVGYEENY